MAENTPVSRKFLGNSTEQLADLHGKARQIVVDTDKQTLVVMDGTTQGGHPLAKENVKIKSGSAGLKVNNGTEATLASDITLTADLGATLVDGQIDFDDEEQIVGIIGGKPVGALVAYDCCPDCSTAEDVVVGGQFNTKEIITESGEWEAPVTGTYRITVIGGGDGSHIAHNTGGYIYNGKSGGYVTKFVQLTKGQVIPVTIGAGGQHVNYSAAGDQMFGGVTSFGDITSEDADRIVYGRSCLNFDLTSKRGIGLAGAGEGGSSVFSPNSIQGYGCGGCAGVDVITVNQPATLTEQDGAQGCVIAEWYDASKDKNISIDMASSITIKELQSQLAQLTVRVQELENE